MNFHPATPSHTEQDENPNQPELITERLTLRHLREADIPDIVESCRDPQMTLHPRTAELHARRRRGLPTYYCPPDCCRADSALGD